ncbi:threonine synthase [Francisellaceae bacterium]|nr:threonine synthase [Francisellaceae bacterium]
MYQLLDFETKQVMKTDDFVFTGESSPWEVKMDIEQIKKRINLDYFTAAAPCLAKYLPLMPIQEPANFVSLRETATPLLKSKVIGEQLGIDLYFKVEGKNPTGSFKDRGSSVDITVAKEMGAKGIILASTGNMAASCSCYAAAAKMPCFIVVPEGVSMSKLAQVISFGGKIVQVKGTYNDAAELAYKLAKRMGFFLAGDYAFRVEGQKTGAFEIIDQMLFQVPDRVVIPIGCGTNMTAYARGFEEYNQLGLISKTPKLVGVQATGAKALVNSFEKGSSQIESTVTADTFATAIAVPDPIDGTKALAGIYSTEGDALDVSDTEMLQAQYLLSTQEGLFVESASASTVAYLLKRKEQGLLIEGETVVCVLSGEGLKDPSVVLNAAIQPPTIFPDEASFMRLYDSNFFENKTMVFGDRQAEVFASMPAREKVVSELGRLFGSHYDDQVIDKIEILITKFLEKGKVITISDFQDIVQDVHETLESPRLDTFAVKDFSVSTAKNKISEARVRVSILDKEYEASAQGVGPVDAVVSALCKACPGEINFTLTNYRVKIRGEGVNAVVYVELKILKDGFASEGHAASPDIIQASVEAFSDAYNAA